MSIVVTDKCVGHLNAACVAECPAACIHTDGKMAYIDPVECIECEACIIACPVNAISYDTALGDAGGHWARLNKTGAAQFPLLAPPEDFL